MKGLTRLVATVGAIVAVLVMSSSPNVSAQTPQGPAQSDHALLDASVPEHVHCGVKMVGNQAEPYTLHVAASSAAAATLTIKFGDASTISFNIPAWDSFSTTQELGGVPGVDDVVKIELTSGGAMASVKVRAGAKDPFTGDGEADNFCLTHPGDPGAAPFE